MRSDPRLLVRATAAALLLASVLGAQPAHAGNVEALACARAVCVLPARPVWPDGVPAIDDWPGSAPTQGPDQTSADGEIVFNVTRPGYQAFLPETGRATGAAVLLAPGGGFWMLAERNEGTRVARWLAEHGIAAFVLRYRTFYRAPGDSDDVVRKRVFASMAGGKAGDASLIDGIEALRQIRSHAAEFGIDPSRIGVAGFSAGGHVAGMMALAPDVRDRPDFVGLIYGMPLTTPALPPANLPYPPGTPAEPWLRPAPTPAPGAMPPTFMAMAQDDLAVGSGFRTYYDTLFAAGYRPELHLYQSGGHGFGMKRQGSTTDDWLAAFDRWIEATGFKRAAAAGP